jgi:hypothetical protein
MVTTIRIEAVIELLKPLAEELTYPTDEDGEVSIYDMEFDDLNPYEIGKRDGEICLARRLLKMLHQ